MPPRVTRCSEPSVAMGRSPVRNSLVPRTTASSTDRSDVPTDSADRSRSRHATNSWGMLAAKLVHRDPPPRTDLAHEVVSQRGMQVLPRRVALVRAGELT